MNDSVIIRRETEQDRRAVENLAREPFWNVYRPGCIERYDAQFPPKQKLKLPGQLE